MSDSTQPFDPLALAYKPKKRFKLGRPKIPFNRKIAGIFLAVIVVAALVAGGYTFIQNQKPKESPEEIAQRQAQLEAQKKRGDLINAVAKQIALPVDEEPLIATVSDKNELQNQEFFQEAQNGDMILLYPKNKKAFLYRPSINRVLVTAPLKYMPGAASEPASESGEVTQPDAAVAGEQTAPQPQQPEPEHGKVLIDNQD